MSGKFPEERVSIVELDRHPEGAAIQRMLAQKTGQRTVPSMFVRGKHVGGYSESSAAFAKGELQKLIAGN